MSLPIGFVVASGPFHVGADERIAGRAANAGIAKWIPGQAVITRCSPPRWRWWKRPARWIRIGTGRWRAGKGRGRHHPNITARKRGWGRIVGTRTLSGRWRMVLVRRMRRLGGGRFDEGELARSPPRATAGGASLIGMMIPSTTMTGRAGCRRRRGRRSIHILGRQILHRLVPIEIANDHRLSGLNVVPAQGVIPGEHEMIEIRPALGHASADGDVEGCLLGSLISILARITPGGGSLLELPADLGGLLPQRLAGLLPGLLVADVAPEARLVVHLEEAAGGALRPPPPDDVEGDDGLVEALGIHVLDLAVLDPPAVALVAGVVVRPPAAAVQDVVGGGIADVLHLLLSHLWGWDRAFWLVTRQLARQAN
mmetsp:Transcript_8170/g.22746  ORF Transcript_8170/g.22746 Transcript_8170/m.22746 type:complete len:369 (+) Transcript_8170:1332-2438(+)